MTERMQSQKIGERTGSRPSAAEGGGASAPALRPADHRSKSAQLLPAWTKNRENNPMQSRGDPDSQHSCCAASGAGEEKGSNLISSRSSLVAGVVADLAGDDIAE